MLPPSASRTSAGSAIRCRSTISSRRRFGTRSTWWYAAWAAHPTGRTGSWSCAVSAICTGFRARNPVHMADTAQLHEPVRPVGCAAHAAYHHVLRVPNRRLEEMVDRHRMAEPAEVREADGGSIRTPLRRDLPDQRQFGVGGGKKNDVARRQAQIDGGIAVVDAGHVAGEQVHRLA